MLTLKEFKQARSVLSGVILNTNLIYSKSFSKAAGNHVYIKPENMQVTGAYKIRGAYYKISTLSGEDLSLIHILADRSNHHNDHIGDHSQHGPQPHKYGNQEVDACLLYTSN